MAKQTGEKDQALQPEAPGTADPTVPAGEQPLWSLTLWDGLVNYECSECAFATLSEAEMIEHRRWLHGDSLVSVDLDERVESARRKVSILRRQETEMAAELEQLTSRIADSVATLGELETEQTTVDKQAADDALAQAAAKSSAQAKIQAPVSQSPETQTEGTT